ncbi:L-aspartate oxidase [Bacillus songklensis]|uniref:L-aspartate oxidase n=1 Tax=Bacillus songklensis TaxID=1069116 RepID=A0ABV8B040_9BACI
MQVYDVVIIGSGLAAWMTAHSLPKNKTVAMLTKQSRWSSNSMLAQGGVAAVFSKEDHWSSHYRDTMTAGCEYNNEQAVEYLVKRGPALIHELMRSGLRFDCNEHNEVLLGREGAHTCRRILHAGGDATGKALVSFLYQQAHHYVDMIEYEKVQELIVTDGRCVGVWTQNSAGELSAYYAQHVVLATGGCGALYSYTSNTPEAVGNGLSLAYRAGAELVDLEFIQFHPTLLVQNGKAVGLVSEAVRGEGAVLVNGHGERIMKGVHELEDLAPRDIVSREIYKRMTNGEQIFLSIKNVKNFTKRFPTITSLCRTHGINLEKQLIPVMPGAHFHMGGVKVNMFGETNIQRLYAVGEAACSGVHGANRLASNSLLEGLVFGELVAKRITERQDEPIIPVPFSVPFRQEVPLLPSKTYVQEMMMSHVGIVRSHSSLTRMVRLLEECLKEVEGNLLGYKHETIECIHMITAAYVIAKSALEREESRGAHFRSDFPAACPRWSKQKIIRQKEKVLAWKV